MGTYLNPGNYAFSEAVNSEIFVDKTELIIYLNKVARTKQKYICISRPRRFGKTMAADMISAYYSLGVDSRPLFEDKKLTKTPLAHEESVKRQSWDIYLRSFNVIRLTMTDFFKRGSSTSKALSILSSRILDELAEQYPEVLYDPDDLFYSMSRFHQKSGIQFVVVIDEWDAIFRLCKEDIEGQTEYLDFLRDWLKDKEYIALAYMTGILPIKKYGEHSALNMFQEFSMTAQRNLAEYTGFTPEEVGQICDDRNLHYEAMREWYDGYLLSNLPSRDLVKEEEIKKLLASGEFCEYEIYNPLSVVSAATNRSLENYWNKTETYFALADYINMDYDGLKNDITLLMDSGRIKVDTRKYQNDMSTFNSKDDIFALLIHLGYLGYDSKSSEVFIPNKELLDEFQLSTSSPEWDAAYHMLKDSQELLEATWAGREEEVAERLEAVHDKADNKTYNDEAALSYAIRFAYFSAQKYYTEIYEYDSGKGYADIVFLPSPAHPDKPALLIELKYNQDVETAYGQIMRQNYPDRLVHYKGNLLLVGINYNRVSNENPMFKHHTCKIVKV